LKNGKNLDALAKELGVTKQTARGLKRGNSAEVIGSEGVALFLLDLRAIKVRLKALYQITVSSTKLQNL